MRSEHRHYRGYSIDCSAHRLPDGYFSSNVSLERGRPLARESQYRFYAVGYFDNEEAALRHSDDWARQWIDVRG